MSCPSLYYFRSEQGCFHDRVLKTRYLKKNEDRQNSHAAVVPPSFCTLMTRTKRNPGTKSSSSSASPSLTRPLVNQPLTSALSKSPVPVQATGLNPITLEPSLLTTDMPTPSQPSDSNTPHGTTVAIKSPPVKRQIRRVSLSLSANKEEKNLPQVRFADTVTLPKASSHSTEITTSPNHAIHCITKEAQEERTQEEMRTAMKETISGPSPLRPKNPGQSPVRKSKLSNSSTPPGPASPKPDSDSAKRAMSKFRGIFPSQ